MTPNGEGRDQNEFPLTEGMAASSWAAPIKYSILVVDDMQTDQRVLAAHLERMGHNVLTASSGEQALRYLFSPSFIFDIVLLDVHLGTMSGLEVLHQIQDRPDLRDSLCVIMVTSDVAESSLMTSVLVGARGFLLKPVNAKKLSSAITRAMTTPPTHHHAPVAQAPVGTGARRAVSSDVSSGQGHGSLASAGAPTPQGHGAGARRPDALLASPAMGQPPRSPERPFPHVEPPTLASPPIASGKTMLIETLHTPAAVGGVGTGTGTGTGAGSADQNMLPGQMNLSPARANLGSVPVDVPAPFVRSEDSSSSASVVQVSSHMRGDSRADLAASSAGSDEDEDDVFGPGSTAGPTPRRRKEPHTDRQDPRGSREARKARSGGGTSSSTSSSTSAAPAGGPQDGSSTVALTVGHTSAPTQGLSLGNAAFGSMAGFTTGLSSVLAPAPALPPPTAALPPSVSQAVAPPPVPAGGAAATVASAGTVVSAVRPDTRPSSGSGQGGAPPTLRALVVDDSRVILRSVTQALQKANIAVEVAESGEAALNILRREEAHRLALVQQQQQFLLGKGSAAQMKARRLQGLSELAGQGALGGGYGTSMQGGSNPGMLSSSFTSEEGGMSASSSVRKSSPGAGRAHLPSAARQAWGDGADPVALTLFPGTHAHPSAGAKSAAEPASSGPDVPASAAAHIGASGNPLFAKAHASAADQSGTASQAAAQPITPIDPDKPLFDIMLLDLIMPYMDGRDVLRHMKNMIPSGVTADAHHFTPCVSGVPVVVMTGIDDSEGVSECFDFGAEDVLQKPVRGDVLLARINKVLSARNLTSFMNRHMDVLAGAQPAAQNQAGGEADALAAQAKHVGPAVAAQSVPLALIPMPQATLPPLPPPVAGAAGLVRPAARAGQGLENVIIGGVEEDEAALAKAAKALGLPSAHALRLLVGQSRRGSTTSSTSPSAASGSGADEARRNAPSGTSLESGRAGVPHTLPSKGQATEGTVPELVLPAFIRSGLGRDSEQLLNDTSVTAGGGILGLSLAVSVPPSPTSSGATTGACGVLVGPAEHSGAEKGGAANGLTASPGGTGGAFQAVHTSLYGVHAHHHQHSHTPSASGSQQEEVLKLKEQLLQEKRRRVTDVKALQEKLVALESTAKTSNKDLAFAKKQIATMSEQLQGFNAQTAQLRGKVKVLQREAAGRGYIPSFYTPNPFASKERLCVTAGGSGADSSMVPGPGEVLAVRLATGTAVGIADVMDGISVPLGPGTPTEVVTVGIAPRSSAAVFHLPSVLIVPHEMADPTSMLIRGFTVWQPAKVNSPSGRDDNDAGDHGMLAIPAPPGWKPLSLCVGSLPFESGSEGLSGGGRAQCTSFAECNATQIPLPQGGLTASSPEWINITASVAGLPAFFSSLFLHFILSLSPHAAVRTVLGYDQSTQVASGISPKEPRIYAEDWAWYCAFNAPMNTGPTSMTRAGRLWSVLCVQAGGPAHGWMPVIKPSLGLDDLWPIVHGLIAFHRDLASLRGDMALEGAYSDWVLAAIITSLSGHGRCHMTYQSVLGSNLVEALHVLTTTPTRQVAPFAPDAFLKSLSEFDRARRLSDPDFILPDSSERGTTNSSLTTAAQTAQAVDGTPTAKDTPATRPEGIVNLLGMARSAQRVVSSRSKPVLTATGGAVLPSTTTIAGRLSPYIVFRLLTGGKLPTPSSSKACSSPGLSWRDWVYLTLAERDRCSEESAAYWFAALDADGDGFISLEDARMALAGKALTWAAVLEASTGAVLDPTSLLSDADGLLGRGVGRAGSATGTADGTPRAWQGSLASRPPPSDMHGGEVTTGTAHYIRPTLLGDAASRKEEHMLSSSQKVSRGTMHSPGTSPTTSPITSPVHTPDNSPRSSPSAAQEEEAREFGVETGPQPLGKLTTTARAAKAARASAGASSPTTDSASSGSAGTSSVGDADASTSRDPASTESDESGGGGGSRGRSVMSVLSELWDQVSPAKPDRGITLLDLRRSGAGPRMYELLIAANKGSGKQ